MLKNKRVITSKKSPKLFPQLNPKLMALCVLAAVVLVGGFVFNSMKQKASINLLGDSGPKYPPFPTATPRPLCATVATLSLVDNCGIDSFRTMTYSCAQYKKKDRFHTLGANPKICKSASEWYMDAQIACAATCPSPTPAPTTGPVITPKPSGSTYPYPAPSSVKPSPTPTTVVSPYPSPYASAIPSPIPQETSIPAPTTY